MFPAPNLASVPRTFQIANASLSLMSMLREGLFAVPSRVMYFWMKHGANKKEAGQAGKATLNYRRFV